MKRICIIIAILSMLLMFPSLSEQEGINYITIWNNGGTIAEKDYFPENDWVISNDGKYACKITEVYSSNYGTLVIKFKIGVVNNDIIKSLVTGESEFGENDFATMMQKNWGMQISSNVTSFTLARDNTYVYECSYRFIDGDSFSKSGTMDFDFSVNDIPEDLFDFESNLINKFEKETTLEENDVKESPTPKQNRDKDSSSNVEIDNTVEDKTEGNEKAFSENINGATSKDTNFEKTEYSLSINGVYIPLLDDQDHHLSIYTINDDIYVPIVPFLNALGMDYSIESDRVIVNVNQSLKTSNEEGIDYYTNLLPEERIYVDAITKKATSFKNPSSIISKYLFYIGSSEETDGYLFITELSAQNSFGGYTSEYYMVISDGTASYWTKVDEGKAIELIAVYGDTLQQEFDYSRINNAIKQKIKELGF